MVATSPDAAAALASFADGLRAGGWVRALWVGGSWATGDHVDGVSDLDLVAILDGPIEPRDQADLLALHRRAPRRTMLGCTYVVADDLDDTGRRHPTYTHGVLVDRPVSAMARCELAQHGYAMWGPSPQDLLPAAGPDEVRDAVHAELRGYWHWATRRPWLWVHASMQDLAVTTALRARIALDRGELVTKTVALDDPGTVPPWLVERTRRRRQGVRDQRRRWAGAVAARSAMTDLLTSPTLVPRVGAEGIEPPTTSL